MLAGTVYKVSGTLNIDDMGGLLQRTPRTGWLFAFSGISIAGIPPFNGFLGEFLIYVAAYYGIAGHTGVPLFIASLLTMIILALVGGVAAGAFVKAIGGVFLGEPRTRQAADAGPAPLLMDLPPLFFTLLSVVLIIAANSICTWTLPVISEALQLPAERLLPQAVFLGEILGKVSTLCLIVTGFFILLLAIRSILGRGQETTVRGTWDCGYAAPDARMEYTGTAFTQPLSDLLHKFTGWRKEVQPPQGYFPRQASIRITTSDPATGKFWAPIFRGFGTAAVKVRFLQSGLLHLYILIMTAALILLLFWGFFCSPGMKDTHTHPESISAKEVTR